MPKLGHEELEALNRTTSAHSGVDCIAASAQSFIFGPEIEAAVEVERRAILVELRPDAAVIGKDEVDLLRPPKKGAAYCSGRDAAGPFSFDPPILLLHRARLDRDAQDHLVLYDKPCDGLEGSRLGGQEPEQDRHEPKEGRHAQTELPTIKNAASQRRVERSMNCPPFESP